MAFLTIVEGESPGKILELHGPRVVLGRHPSCEIVLDNAAVSRHHAQILESHGSYYLEDLRSRNRTYLNGVAVEGRNELAEADQVKVCNFLFAFHEQRPNSGVAATSDSSSTSAKSKPHRRGPSRIDHTVAELSAADSDRSAAQPAAEKPSDSSSIITTLQAQSGSSLNLAVQPEARLKAILEIGSTLANTLNLEDVLQTTLESLFRIFPQADDSFVMLKDPERDELVVKARKTRWPQEPEDKARVSMTVVEEAINKGQAILSADAVRDSRFEMSDSLSGLQIRSMMCAPLADKEGKPLGVMQVATRDLKKQFSSEDLELLVSVASQVSLAVDGAYLHEELLRQRELEHELKIATQVQLGFLPSQRPKLAGYEFSDYYEAALRVGGDYFDYITLPGGRIAVAIGDVAGKGIPAALLMARLYSSVRLHLLTKETASEALTAMNAEIASSGLGHRFVTFVVAVVDPVSHEVILANAGHLPPMLRHGDGKVETVGKASSGMPLGISPTQQYAETKLSLEPGESLVFYTDGITEAMNPSHDIYGRPRLVRYLRRAPKNVESMTKGIVADVEKFCRGCPQSDDVCLVSLHRVT